MHSNVCCAKLAAVAVPVLRCDLILYWACTRWAIKNMAVHM